MGLIRESPYLIVSGDWMIISFNTDGKDCWKRDNIKVELQGSSGYKVVVEGRVREEDIVCTVPDVVILLQFLSRLFNGGTPVFRLHSELEYYNPATKCD